MTTIGGYPPAIDLDKLFSIFEDLQMTTRIQNFTTDLDAAQTAIAAGHTLDVERLIQDFKEVIRMWHETSDELRTIRAVDKNRTEELRQCTEEARQHVGRTNELRSESRVAKVQATSAQAEVVTVKEQLAAANRMVVCVQKAFSDNERTLTDLRRKVGKASDPHAKTITSLTKQVTNAMRALSDAGIGEFGDDCETRIARRIDHLQECNRRNHQSSAQNRERADDLDRQLNAAKEIIAKTHKVLDRVGADRSDRLCTRVESLAVHNKAGHDACGMSSAATLQRRSLPSLLAYEAR